MKLISRFLILSLVISSAFSSSMAMPNNIFFTPPVVIMQERETIASITGKYLRISYVMCGNDGKALGCVMETRVNGKWKQFMSPVEDNKVFVITGPERLKKPVYKPYFPSWASGDTLTTNPYLSGDVCEAIPIKAVNIDKNTIAVDYVTAGDHNVKGVWSISPGGKSASLTLDFTPSKTGCYSLGIMGLHAPTQSSVTNVLLPPMYQYHRIPHTPDMMLSVMMPTPVAMVEAEVGGERMTAFVSGDASLSPLDWGSVDHSPMGFSLKQYDNNIAPTAFSPVIGMKDSHMKQGVTIRRRFEVGLSATPWNEALEYVSTDVYRVRDYRHQPDKSLTETMFSIVELMNDDTNGGWDNNMRGHYDIEGKPTKAPTVVHSAPLAIVAAAITASDEDLYMRRALPTIEYTLSRKGFRWSSLPTEEGYNKDPETLRLSPFGSQFPTTYYEGLNRLLGRRNEWLTEIALPDGELRVPRGYSTPILSWVQALAAYKLTGNNKWYQRAKSTAERDARLHIYANSDKPVRYQAFYNSTTYSPWWDFIDLYEATGDHLFLEAARYGAAHTLAGIRTWPQVNDSIQTIHQGNIYNGNTTMWWKGNRQYRLGFPRADGDAPEHDVEQWKVSPVGLGFEQPSTYFLRNKGKFVRPVYMSSWAPAFLNLNRHNGLDIFDIYARNAVIGRYSNYPGYYATGYTDITMDEKFPYKGPDVSSIYYHHIPPHLAFVTDYLVSETIQRSAGNVSFPYGRQEGFVWFSNRIYGGEPGKIFDDTNSHLWLKKGLISSSNPEINYVTAVSDKRFWILLSNENHLAVTTSIKAGVLLTSIADMTSDVTIYDAKGSRKKIGKAGGKLDIKIEPKGFTAISIPLAKDSASNCDQLRIILGSDNIPALKEGFKVIESGTEAGKIYTFRIRSPFGWDSVYGYCETIPTDGISVKVSCGSKNADIEQYPYEWSFAKFAPTENITINVSISDYSGKTVKYDITI